MDKFGFISRVKESHRLYETTLASLNEKQIHRLSTCGEWSVKDVIAHVTWYEREMVGVLKERALIGSERWNITLEQRNAAIYAEYQASPLLEILIDSQQVFRSMLDLMEGLTNEDLLDASHFREMPSSWIPWQMIASNTFEHYPLHTNDIRKAFPGQVP